MEEGNYDVPVTPNRLDSVDGSGSTPNGASKAGAGGLLAPIGGAVGHRMVNASSYYQNQQHNGPSSNRLTTAMLVNGRLSPMRRSTYAVQGHQSAESVEKQRTHYFVKECTYDNSDGMRMASRKPKTARSVVMAVADHRHGGHFGQPRKEPSNVLPPPTKIIAYGGVPINADQPRLVKPSAFRPVQPASWQTTKAARVEICSATWQRRPGNTVLDGHRRLADESSANAVADQLYAEEQQQEEQRCADVEEPEDEDDYDVAGTMPSGGSPSRVAGRQPDSGSEAGLLAHALADNGASQNHPLARHIASRSSRNSSGIQVTPSPSDSGVAEYEAAMREKDTEILKLRNMMEHNEQVIIRVYQEKEERWQEKLREWSNRLQAAMHNEKKLLSQVQFMQQDRKEAQDQINNLYAEKQGLLKKVRQFEKEVFELRAQLNTKAKQWSVCQSCSNVFMPQALQQSQREKCSPHSTDALRNELDALRLEVCEIRHSLQGQAS